MDPERHEDEVPDGLICTLGPPICRARHLYRTECQSLLDSRQLACNVLVRHLVQLAEEVGRLDQVVGLPALPEAGGGASK